MKPREEQKQGLKAPRVREQPPKPRLRIVKLEQRIAPLAGANHNETLARDRPAKAR
jgi:hypothetical protein